MSRAWNKEKIWVPAGNRTHDLPYTGRVVDLLQVGINEVAKGPSEGQSRQRPTNLEKKIKNKINK